MAQDLGVRPLTNQAKSVAEAAGLDLSRQVRDLLYELMLADIDHEYLDDPALDGFVDDPIFGPPGMLPGACRTEPAAYELRVRSSAN